MKKDKILKRCAAVFIILTAALLLLFADAVRQEILQALSLSVGTVIPGLFPFLVLSETAAHAGLLTPKGMRTERFMRKYFGISARSVPAVVFGLTGGYLTGIKTALSLYENGKITKEEAQKLCGFCISPGLAFAVSAVGSGMLGKLQSGFLLFFACTLSAVILGLTSSRKELPKQAKAVFSSNEKLSVSFTKAVQKSASSCLSLTAWMAVFAALQAVVFSPLPSNMQAYFSLFSEVTAGALQTAKSGSLSLCAAVLAFGGLCIFCQVLPDLQALEMPVFLFLRNRLLHAFLAAAFCKVGLFLFPSADIRVAVSLIRPYSTNPSASFFLLLACFIFILDLAPQKKTWYTECGR